MRSPFAGPRRPPPSPRPRGGRPTARGPREPATGGRSRSEPASTPRSCLFAPQHQGGVGAGGGPSRKGSDQVGQKQGGGDGDADGEQRNDGHGQNAELVGEDAPRPPPYRDSHRKAHQQ